MKGGGVKASSNYKMDEEIPVVIDMGQGHIEFLKTINKTIIRYCRHKVWNVGNALSKKKITAAGRWNAMENGRKFL
jgi:hypothetical protein